VLEAWTLEDGAQAPEAVGDRLVAWLADARVSLDLALYDVPLLSRSGEMNAENVLEVADAALAERLASWIDGLRARYTEIP
jgi:hypothetical protein